MTSPTAWTEAARGFLVSKASSGELRTHHFRAKLQT